MKHFDPPHAVDGATPDRPFVKRRQRLIKSRLQLRVIGVFAGITLLAQLFQTLLVASQLASLAGSMPSGGQHLAEATPLLVGKALAISSLALLPLVLLVGISATFRLAGPLYAIDRFLRGVRDGERTAPLCLRHGDELQDLCTVVNEVTEPLRGRVEEARPERDAA